MRWLIHIHHQHGTEEIHNAIEGDTIPIPEGLAVQAVTIAPEPSTTVIPPTAVPGGPPEPTFAAPETEAASDTAAGLTP